MNFRGSSAVQDTRFGDKNKKLLKTLLFPECFSKKVDMKKVQLKTIRPWIAKKVGDLLGFEDDVVLEFIFNLLDEETDPRQIQIKLTGFLEHHTLSFMEELWKLLLSAQSSPTGIPKEFLDSKIEEIRNKREQDEKLAVNLSLKREKMEQERIQRSSVSQALGHQNSVNQSKDSSKTRVNSLEGYKFTAMPVQSRRKTDRSRSRERRSNRYHDREDKDQYSDSSQQHDRHDRDRDRRRSRDDTRDSKHVDSRRSRDRPGSNSLKTNDSIEAVDSENEQRPRGESSRNNGRAAHSRHHDSHSQSRSDRDSERAARHRHHDSSRERKSHKSRKISRRSSSRSPSSHKRSRRRSESSISSQSSVNTTSSNHQNIRHKNDKSVSSSRAIQNSRDQQSRSSRRERHEHSDYYHRSRSPNAHHDLKSRRPSFQSSRSPSPVGRGKSKQNL
ncbi:hypothetical protein MT418_006021 [Batrachochytrium dendrobatidis]